jgi:hypothetical protein
MVASSPIHDRPSDAETPGNDAQDFSRYSHPIDRDAAGMEGTGGHGAPVPLAFHEAFKRPRSMSAIERRELQIKQCALRIAAGLEMRSLRELAKEIGCSHTAIDNMVARLCERLGMRKFHVSDVTRERMRAARRRQLGQAARQ